MTTALTYACTHCCEPVPERGLCAACEQVLVWMAVDQGKEYFASMKVNISWNAGCLDRKLELSMSLVWQEDLRYVECYDRLCSFLSWARMMFFITALVWIAGIR